MIRVELLVLMNLLLIGLLPRLLFRTGRMNGRWWLTAGPLLVAAAAQIASLGGILEHAGPIALAAPVATLSMLLIAYTIGAHRQRISMWHQANQQSQELVTWGPYAWMRHPLYSAFQLTLVASALAVPHVLTLAALLFGLWQFRRTAIIEEGRLLQSPLGAAYRAYAQRTNRFVPLRRRAGHVRADTR